MVKDGGAGDQGDAAAKDYEICTVAAECQAGIASAGNGATTGNGSMSSPQAVAVDPDTGNVYVSDAGNNRVNEYDGTGAFIRSFGWDVVTPGESGDVPGTDEVQTVSLDPGVDGSFRLIFGGAGTQRDRGGRHRRAGAKRPGGRQRDRPRQRRRLGAAGGPWTVHFQGDLAERDVAAAQRRHQELGRWSHSQLAGRHRPHLRQPRRGDHDQLPVADQRRPLDRPRRHAPTPTPPSPPTPASRCSARSSRSTPTAARPRPRGRRSSSRPSRARRHRAWVV